MKKIRTVFLWCRWLLIFLISAALLVMGGTMLWVASGPRSLAKLTPYIEKSLAAPDGSYRIAIGETMLLWESWQRPLDIRIRNVRMMTGVGVRFGHFDEVSLGFKFSSLLAGQLVPATLSIEKPSMHFFQNADGSFSFGFGAGGDATGLAVGKFIERMTTGGDQATPPIRSFKIRDAILKIGNAESRDLLSLRVNSTIKRYKKGIAAARLELTARDTDRFSNAQIDLQFSPSAPITGSFTVNDLMPSLFSRFVSSAILEGTKLPLKGKGSFRVQPEGGLDYLGFTITGESGELNEPLAFPKPLRVKDLYIKGAVSERFKRFSVEKLQLDLGGPLLSYSGDSLRQDDGWIVSGLAVAERVPIKSLAEYWPLALGKDARDWVTLHITDGFVPRAEAQFVINPGATGDEMLPEDALDAKIQVKNATVKYLKNHPAIEQVDGVVAFTGKTMEITATSGRALTGTTLRHGTISIANLHETPLRAVLNLDLTAPAKDVAHYMNLPELVAYARRIGLNEKTISGAVEGKLNIATRFSEAVKPDLVTFDARLKDVTQPGFLGEYDVSLANGPLALGKDKISWKGRLVANSLPVEMELTHAVSGVEKSTTRYRVKALLPADKLPAMGFAKHEFLSGDLGVDASVTQNEASQKVSATIDLTKASLDFSQYQWKKPRAIPATLLLETQKIGAGGPLEISKISFQSEGAAVLGSMTLSPSHDSVLGAKLSTLKFGRNDLALEYQKNGSLVAKGSRVDLAPYLQVAQNFSREKISPMELDAKLGQVLLSGDRELNDVSAKISCDTQKCRSAAISGLVAGKSFSLRISPEGSGRSLDAKAADAGELIRTLGFYPNMIGGQLSLTGAFDDNKTGNPLTGKLEISEHVLRQAPVLTKILTLASFSGIVDTLGGKGISFTKLSAPFVMTGDRITLNDAKTYGSAMGLTAKGTIDLKAKKLDMEGTVVPSYTLNSMLGSVPLVGEVLTGGKGQGLFAARYSLEGDIVEPRISINPLSILTPGFLRNLFDIFDSKPAETPPAENKAPEEKKRQDKESSPSSASPKPEQPDSNKSPGDFIGPRKPAAIPSAPVVKTTIISTPPPIIKYVRPSQKKQP